ncbi:MAG: AmmeMemoRadiSam system protein B [Pirellulales bacterium]|nr:AmmeMemoRadiSam system protein B [Pirellulales bacterium]
MQISREKPALTADDERRIFLAAAERVSAAVMEMPSPSPDKTISDLADTPLYGIFVSLKHGGRLRSCCGYLNPVATLGEALIHAADRAAKDDPRFPPIAAEELEYLKMEVWILWGKEEIAARGEDRAREVIVGKHGLQIAQGLYGGLLLPGVATEHGFDARTFLSQTCLKAGLPPDAWLRDDASVFRFEGYAIRGDFPWDKNEIRFPSQAGSFYPGSAGELDRALGRLFDDPRFRPPNGAPQRQSYAAAMVPHAGWVYSGHLAAAVLERVEFPERVVVLCPKHYPGGAGWAVAPHRRWRFPGGEVSSDPELAARLADGVQGLQLDAEAHRQEHAIEVQIPLLARLAPQARVVGISVGQGALDEALRFASQMADVLRDMPQRPLLIISSDMNHFADDGQTRRVDRLALDAIESLDPRRLYETVRENRISMCGMYPCAIVMETLRQLDALHRAELVGYATSAEVNGQRDRVVGYAGMLFE